MGPGFREERFQDQPITGLDDVRPDQLAVIGKFAIPFGGLSRGRLAIGETLVVNGATGHFGSGAVLVGLALGAARVVAAGRRREVLAELESSGGGRVVGVTLTGKLEQDRSALREAAGGGADVALDFVGGATDPNSTLATLTSLRRRGRMVLMGSLRAPLPLDSNCQKPGRRGVARWVRSGGEPRRLGRIAPELD